MRIDRRYLAVADRDDLNGIIVTWKAQSSGYDCRVLNRRARLLDEQAPDVVRTDEIGSAAMMRIVPALLLGLAVAGCNIEINSCSGEQICISKGGERIVGSGTVRTEARAVDAFTAVRLVSAGRVVIERGDSDAVTVTSDDNLLQKITTEVRNGALVLDIATGTGIVAHELVYRVTVRDLKAISASGAGTIQADGLASTSLAVTIAGSSRVQLSGSVADLKLAISGSGTINAAALLAERISVAVSGSGNVSVNARAALDVAISGSGKVTYAGRPKLRTQISGSGSLRHVAG
jgi:hypothetical protein